MSMKCYVMGFIIRIIIDEDTKECKDGKNKDKVFY